MILKHCQKVEPFDIMLTNTIYVPLITILITTPMSAIFNILLTFRTYPLFQMERWLV